MNRNPVRGKTLLFAFDDGQMAGKTFEHRFDEDGTVTFRALDGAERGPAKPKADREPGTKYEIATVRDDVWAVSYLSSAGYTLTAVLDFAKKTLVAFSSNEKTLSLQYGSFTDSPQADVAKPRGGGHARA